MKLKLALLAAAMSLAPATAQAVVLKFSLAPKDAARSDAYRFTFLFDTARTPSFQTADTVRYAPTTLTYQLPNDPAVYTDTISNLGFSAFTQINQGGISYLRLPRGTDPQPRFFGPALFTGPTSAPAFQIGSYDLSTTPKNVPSDVQVFDYRLSIGTVPEPASWGLLMVGIGIVGASARRRRKVQATA